MVGAYIPWSRLLRTILPLTTLLSCGAAGAQHLALVPITFASEDGRRVAAERGVFMVPENRADPHSRQIPLTFVRFRAIGRPASAPLLYLAGGPGTSGIETARGDRFDVFMALRNAGDVIALDQRGTGSSNSIPACEAPQNIDTSRPITRQTFVDHYRNAIVHCWSFWRRQGVNIASYNSLESAADIEDLRRALRVPKLSLWGISYGTHLALAVTRRYPGSIERLALASVEGLDQTVKLPERLEPALQRLAAELGEPLLADRMRRVHAQLNERPVHLQFRRRDGTSVDYSIGSFPLQYLASALVKNPDTAVDVPLIYRAIDSGRQNEVAELIYNSLFARGTLLAGMPEAMDLTSGISSRRLRKVERQAPLAVFGDAMNFPMPQLVGVIPNVELPNWYRAPYRSRHPLLLLSGTLDVRTPIEEQYEAVAGFRHITRVTVINGGHDILEVSPQIGSLLVQFFRGERLGDSSIILPGPLDASNPTRR